MEDFQRRTQKGIWGCHIKKKVCGDGMDKPKFDDVQARDTQVIDDIKTEWLENATMVLDIGCNDGTTNVRSRHGDWFKKMDAEDRYWGVEVTDFKEQKLKNILMGVDISDVALHEEHFDCVLCISVFEHIYFEKWDEIFEKIFKCLMPGGSLIIAVPYKQRLKDYAMRYPPPVGHTVFDISEETFGPFTKGFKLIDMSIETSNTFDGDGANIVWASLRWLKRWLTRHPYRKSGKTIMLRYEKE